MSEPITPNPEQQSAATKLANRIKELEACAGKWYLRKDGREVPTLVTGYVGTKVRQEMVDGKPTAKTEHVFAVSAIDGRCWTPAATRFLAEHDEIPAPKAATSTQEIL